MIEHKDTPIEIANRISSDLAHLLKEFAGNTRMSKEISNVIKYVGFIVDAMSLTECTIERVKLPEDLVLLPDGSSISDTDVQTVLNARWYVCQYEDGADILMASASELNGLSDTINDDPSGCGVDVNKDTIVEVGLENQYQTDIGDFWYKSK